MTQINQPAQAFQVPFIDVTSDEAIFEGEGWDAVVVIAPSLADIKQDEINLIINNLDKMNFVNYAENEFVRKPKYYPNDAMANIQCSLNSVKAPSAWDFWDIPNGIVPDGSEVLMASVDTGEIILTLIFNPIVG